MLILQDLVQLGRTGHLEGRDGSSKALFAMHILHKVGAVHFAHFGTQVTAADILVLLPGIDLRLHPHHTFSLHFAETAIAVINKPVPAQQFNRIRVMIFNDNFISKHEFIIHRVTVIRLVKCFHAYFNAL